MSRYLLHRDAIFLRFKCSKIRLLSELRPEPCWGSS